MLLLHASGSQNYQADSVCWRSIGAVRFVYLTGEDGEYTESYKQVIRSPLQDARSAEEILEYDHWPSPDWFDYEVIEEQCLQIKDAGRVVVFMGDRLNRIAQLKPACYLRGFERVFIDMMKNPEIARALFR